MLEANQDDDYFFAQRHHRQPLCGRKSGCESEAAERALKAFSA
jgi:hypothetical protein